MPTTHTDTLIIGAGLAGLLCAAKLRQQVPSASIALFDASARPGGKARTEDLSGGLCNIGPHALYCKGPLHHMLTRLGVTPKGDNPAKTRSSFIADGTRLYPMPSSPLAMLAHSHLSASTKWHLSRALLSIQRASPASHARSLDARSWLHGLTRDAHALAILEMLLRLSTYSTAFDTLRASSAHLQLRRAVTSGVLYLDGGWQSLIDALLEPLCEDPLVTLHTRTKVTAIQPGAHTHQVHTTSGTHHARAVILATPPRLASRLLDMPSLTRDLHTTRAACIDMVLSARRESPDLVLGLHQPHYYSVHSRSAALTREDSAIEVAHAMRYLDDARDTIDALHPWLDTVRPGWRDELIAHRTSPKIIVMHHLPTTTPSTLSTLPPRMAIASDWYHDSDELLADAVAHSVERAVESLVTSHDFRAHAS